PEPLVFAAWVSGDRGDDQRGEDDRHEEQHGGDAELSVGDGGWVLPGIVAEHLALLMIERPRRYARRIRNGSSRRRATGYVIRPTPSPARSRRCAARRRGPPIRRARRR